MRDSRRECRIENVNVEADVNGAGSLQLIKSRKSSHLNHLDPELFCLFLLMSVHGADSDLYEALCQSRFHDSRERACVRHPVTAELLIQVGMCIEMKNRQRHMPRRYSFYDWKSNRVIATERDRPLTFLNKFPDTGFNCLESIFVGKLQIASVFVNSRYGKVDARLRPGV